MRHHKCRSGWKLLLRNVLIISSELHHQHHAQQTLNKVMFQRYKRIKKLDPGLEMHPSLGEARMRTAPGMSYDLPTKALLENDIWLQN